MTKLRALGLLLVMAATACGGGGTSDTDAALPMTDGGGTVGGSLVGRWLAQITTGPENQTETLMFADDGSVSAAHSQIDDAAAADHAGCTELVIETGTYLDRSDHTAVMVNPGSSMQIYLSCTSASDNGTTAYTGTPIFLTGAVNLPYTISGDTLTMTVGGSSVAFTRQ